MANQNLSAKEKLTPTREKGRLAEPLLLSESTSPPSACQSNLDRNRALYAIPQWHFKGAPRTKIPHKAVLETSAFEIVTKFLRNSVWYRFADGDKCANICRESFIEDGFFGLAPTIGE